jgi:hypothetical protein
MEVKKFKAVMRARVGDEIVAEIVLFRGTNQLTVDKYIEHIDQHHYPKDVERVLKDFFVTAIVTVEMKFL